MTEERKFAILFAATILAARRLIDLDPDKPSMAKQFFVDRAIDDGVFILERIDTRWPTTVNTFAAIDALGKCYKGAPQPPSFVRSSVLSLVSTNPTMALSITLVLLVFMPRPIRPLIWSRHSFAIR